MKRYVRLLLFLVLLLALSIMFALPALAQGEPGGVPPLIVGTIPLALIIVALVEAAKQIGLPTKYAPWLNAGLSLIGYALVIAVDLVPGSLASVTYVLNALIIFLAAAGFYDRAQAVLKKPT